MTPAFVNIAIGAVFVVTTGATWTSQWYRQRYLPRQAENLLNAGDASGARILLERLLKRPQSLPPTERLRLRLLLAEACRRDDRPEAAARQYQAALADREAIPSFQLGESASETDIRQRLAECLEALELDGAAQQERDHAERIHREGRAEDMEWQRQEAIHLTEAGLHRAAYDRYAEIERTLLSDEPPMQRAAIRVEAAETLFAAGRYTECLSYLSRALDEGDPAPRTAIIAHHLRGHTLRCLGRLEEADTSFQEALAVAHDRQDPSRTAAILCSLARLAIDRGDFVTADTYRQEAHKADPVTTVPTLTALTCDVALHQGNFAAAAHAARRWTVRLPEPCPVPLRRSRASLCLMEAIAHCYNGDGAAAEAAFHEGAIILGQDEKLRLVCCALRLWIDSRLPDPAPPLRGAPAGYGRRAFAPIAVATEARAAASAGTLNAARDALLMLGYAALARRAPAEAVGYFEEARNTSPPPLLAVNCWYHLGLAHEHAGSPDAARLAYEQAAAMCIDTFFARLAQNGVTRLTPPKST